MKLCHYDIDIPFTFEGVTIHAMNIQYGQFTDTVPSHSHGSGCYELHYIPNGWGRLLIQSNEYEAGPGTLYITGPHIEHAQIPIAEDPMLEYCIYLRIEKPSKTLKSTPLLKSFMDVPFWIGKASQNMHSVINQIFCELSTQQTGYILQLELLLSQLIITMIRHYECSKSNISSYLPITPAIKKSLLIEQTFLSEYKNLTLQALAEKLGLSTRQTQRLLKEYYGKTFQQKKTAAKMSAAILLLDNCEQSITSIAETLGFSSAEHFSAAFKKYYHQTPSEYCRKKETP